MNNSLACLHGEVIQIILRTDMMIMTQYDMNSTGWSRKKRRKKIAEGNSTDSLRKRKDGQREKRGQKKRKEIDCSPLRWKSELVWKVRSEGRPIC